MVHFSFVTTITGHSLDMSGQTVSFSVSGGGGTPQVMLYDFGYGEGQEFLLTEDGPTRVDNWVLGAGPRCGVDVAGYGQGSLDMRLLEISAEGALLGQQSAVQMSIGNAGQGRFADQASVLTMDTGAATPVTFVAAADGQGITAFQIDDAGIVQSRVVTADTEARYLGGVSDMVSVTVGGQCYLYATSAQDHGLSGWSVSNDGSLQEVVQVGRAESLPVQTMSALATGMSGDAQFLVAAASGSSSLTVMRVGADGTLDITDHAIDSRDTRFANVTELETVTFDGRLYVLAAGSDDGISLFTVTAEGRLVHLHSLADSEGASLGGVSGIAAVLRDGGIDVLTIAAHEAGMSLFRVELPADGVVQFTTSGHLVGSAGDDMLSLRTGSGHIDAGAGNDILSDGAGSDTLTGGRGQDIFVLSADGRRDVITDIDITQDRLDLSAWAMLRNAGQLQVTQTGQGAIIRFGAEELELRSHNGAPLTAEQVAGLLMQGPSHYEITLGPLQEIDLEPDPIPPPLPTRDTDQRIIGTDNDERLDGGSGNDHINGGAGNDTLYGGAGNDGLIAGSGDDLVYGGDGNDNIPGKAGNDTLYGEAGNDSLGGADGEDLIFGGEGNDVAGGGNHNDTMDAGPGDDWFSGGWGNDVVRGNTGNDKLAGSYDHDTVQGGEGNDSLGGGEGDDLLEGEEGDDVIGSGGGNDTAYGGQGNDSLGGADGDDVLYGGSGDDILNGAHGNDTMEGGAGADTFFFNNFFSSGRDVIRDFEIGIDHLRLVGLHLGPAAGRLDQLQLTDGNHQGVAGTWLKFGNNDIFLDGIAAADLSLSDFLFS